MKILIVCQNFNYLSGAPLYNFELAREYVLSGHEVAIISDIGKNCDSNQLLAHAIAAGINCVDLKDILDDKIELEAPDVIHASEEEPTKFATAAFPKTPIVVTVHSEFQYEKPFKHPNIKKYICIRSEIQTKIITEDLINAGMTTVIYNPIDFNRFSPGVKNGEHVVANSSPLKKVLFVGTIDHLRRAAIMDLFKQAVAGEIDLTIVGKKFEKILDFDLPDSVRWFDQTWDIEKYVKGCDETAGILLGRTTIEGWACGKPGIIYDIDLSGNIKSITKHHPPINIEKFDSRLVAKEILEIYNAVIR